MKSPITSKEMSLMKERRTLDFRKESFEVIFHYYLCQDSKEQFTNTVIDEINIQQVYNQYRDRLNIPFPEEIAFIREQYGLSAVKMSEILGLGINSYRQYEAGEIPTTANAKLILMASDPYTFIEMIKLCGTLDASIKEKYLQKAQLILNEKNKNYSQRILKEYLLGDHLADIFSGYRNPNLEKFTEMTVYFSEKLEPFKTKMNKLLFYADFLMFKQSCFSISGLRYKAIERGPVPNNYQSIFEYLDNTNQIDIVSTEFTNGIIGEQFKAKKDRPFNASLFSVIEIEVLEKVSKFFQHKSTSETIDISHLEKAWHYNHENKQIISYNYAFEIDL
jgi:transcriptional regulator with XRE-family HTH domain